MLLSSYGSRESAWTMSSAPWPCSAAFRADLVGTCQSHRPLHHPAIILTFGAIAFVLATMLCAYLGCVTCGWNCLRGRQPDDAAQPPRAALRYQHEDRQGHEVALAMIDLDSSTINDHYGHFVGDAAIRECAAIFTEVSENEAGVYRLGGDEYAVIGGPVAGTLLEGLCRRIIERRPSRSMSRTAG